MAKEFILALDQGTTSSRAVVFDKNGKVRGFSSVEFQQIYPKAGWVEHNPEEIITSQFEAAAGAMVKAGINSSDLDSIGITNQRETIILWDKGTGKPVYNAIVWQCRRSAQICDDMKEANLGEYIKENTGLVIDAYFSATKIKWIFDNYPDIEKRAGNGEIAAGTVDSWLLWNLTGGKVHATDYSNASRTMLFNIKTLKWDKKILETLGIPESMLPEVRPSSSIYGVTDCKIFEEPVIIGGIAGDQQAALFGQKCFSEGMAKNTYGTGCFLLMNTGEKPIQSTHGLLTTIAWNIDGKTEYAIEGSVFAAGAGIKWLRDEMKMINSAGESEEIAKSLKDNEGVYVVPAFVGLGAPYWDMYARGTITGLTRGSGRAHIVRGMLEAVAYQTKDVIDAMEIDSKIKLASLRVDGGASANNFIMEFQAGILETSVERPKNIEATALGAAFLSGLASGFWKNKEELLNLKEEVDIFYPQMDKEKIDKNIKGWKIAIESTKTR